MAAATAGIEAGQVFRIEFTVFSMYLIQLFLDGFFLFGFVDIIFPLPFEVLIRMAFYPQPPQGIFYHVADDPVRRKQLGSGRDVFFLYFFTALTGKDFVLRFCIVILIEPADNLHLVPEIVFGDIMDEMPDDAVPVRNGEGKQEFRIISDFFK